jgi:nucleoside diphosphate kinase
LVIIKPDAIWGYFICPERYNLIHGSDSQGSVEREIKIFFRSGEIIEYELDDSRWFYRRND